MGAIWLGGQVGQMVCLDLVVVRYKPEAHPLVHRPPGVGRLQRQRHAAGSPKPPAQILGNGAPQPAAAELRGHDYRPQPPDGAVDGGQPGGDQTVSRDAGQRLARWRSQDELVEEPPVAPALRPGQGDRGVDLVGGHVMDGESGHGPPSRWLSDESR